MTIKKDMNNKIVIDGETKAKLDSQAPNLSIFVAKELESMEARLREFIERELYFAEDCPIDQSDPEGAQTVSYKMMGKIATAKFIDASNKNFRLAPDSPAIDSAYGTPPEFDFLGNRRGSSPDRGAIEYSSDEPAPLPPTVR